MAIAREPRGRESSRACATSRTSRSFIKCCCSSTLFSFHRPPHRVRAQFAAPTKMGKTAKSRQPSNEAQKKREKSFIYIFITSRVHVAASSTRWHANATFARAPFSLPTTTQCHKGNKIAWKVKPVPATARIQSTADDVQPKKVATKRRQKKNSTFLCFYELYSSFTHHKCRINYVHFQGHSSSVSAQNESSVCVCERAVCARIDRNIDTTILAQPHQHTDAVATTHSPTHTHMDTDTTMPAKEHRVCACHRKRRTFVHKWSIYLLVFAHYLNPFFSYSQIWCPILTAINDKCYDTIKPSRLHITAAIKAMILSTTSIRCALVIAAARRCRCEARAHVFRNQIRVFRLSVWASLRVCVRVRAPHDPSSERRRISNEYMHARVENRVALRVTMWDSEQTFVLSILNILWKRVWHTFSEIKNKIGENFHALEIVIWKVFWCEAIFSRWNFDFSSILSNIIEIGILFRNKIRCKRRAERTNEENSHTQHEQTERTHTHARDTHSLADGSTYSRCQRAQHISVSFALTAMAAIRRTAHCCANDE